MLTVCSRAHQEEQEGQQHQVQGPLLEERLHPRPQGHRQGREAQAVASPGYALQNTHFRASVLIILLGLTISDVGKKNPKGRHAAA